MPFSFPSSPTVGQISIQNGRSYSWSGYSWQLVGTVSATVASSTSGFPATGQSSYLYLSQDSGRLFQWTGSVYAEIGSLGGDASLWSNLVPGTPSGVSGTAGNAQVTLTWAAPQYSASSITNYLIQYSTDGTNWTNYSRSASTALSAAVTGLSNGSSYSFRVAAVSAIGTGGWSASSATVSLPAADPYFSSVGLLMHMEGSSATFLDSSSSPKSFTTYGNVTQSATQFKFGTKSAAFDGSGDYIKIASSSAFGFSTGDFCIEFFYYVNSASNDETIIDTRSSNVGAWLVFGKGSGGTLRCYDGSTVRTGGSVNVGAWNHFAWARASGTNNLYLNGTRVVTFSNAGDVGSSNPLTIGSNVDAAYENCNGYLDELRITKGQSRGFTGATITVPTSACTDY